MSNINLQTIESLPLVNEATDNTSLVAFDGEKTVRLTKNSIIDIPPITEENDTGFLRVFYDSETGKGRIAIAVLQDVSEVGA